MPLDLNFFQAVETLKAPRAGTELMGPLLYSLIRTTRPRNLLEVGMGYTTPFILEALKDNVSDICHERQRLKIKNEKLLREIKNSGEENFAKNSSTLLLMDEWLEEDPPLKSPAFYVDDYRPVLQAVDDFTSNKSYAHQVQEVIGKMDYQGLFKIHKQSFQNLSEKLDPTAFPIDFIWFDCGGPSAYEDFLNEYWEKMNSDGGYLLLHSTLDRSGFYNVLHYLKLKQATQDFMNFEILSLKEPHKLTQGSVTIVKKINSRIPNFPIERPNELINSIRKL